MENRGGQIWIDAETDMIDQYLIDLPDEPGFKNGRLKLLGRIKITPVEWDRFMISKLNEEN